MEMPPHRFRRVTWLSRVSLIAGKAKIETRTWNSCQCLLGDGSLGMLMASWCPRQASSPGSLYWSETDLFNRLTHCRLLHLLHLLHLLLVFQFFKAFLWTQNFTRPMSHPSMDIIADGVEAISASVLENYFISAFTSSFSACTSMEHQRQVMP